MVTNLEHLRALDENDFADYIYSVFIAGKYFQEKHVGIDNNEFVDYKKWLNEEYCEG